MILDAIDRPLPHNEEAEQSFLGCCMLKYEIAVEAIELVHVEAFYKPANRAIFAAVKTVTQGEHQCDLLDVVDELTRQGKLNEAGGNMGVMRCMTAVPTAVNYDIYAGIINDAWRRRQVIMQAQELLCNAHDPEQDISEAASIAGRSIADIADDGGGDANPSIYSSTTASVRY